MHYILRTYVIIFIYKHITRTHWIFIAVKYFAYYMFQKMCLLRVLSVVQ